MRMAERRLDGADYFVLALLAIIEILAVVLAVKL